MLMKLTPGLYSGQGVKNKNWMLSSKQICACVFFEILIYQEPFSLFF